MLISPRITHREPKLASRRVEELYELLESYGDDMMRAALGRAVQAATLTVAGVRRALSKLGASPRGHQPHQLALPISRVESKRGAS